MIYQPTTALAKIYNLIETTTSNVVIVQGGQGAGKTISILQILIALTIDSNTEISIASKELTKIKLTVMPDFLKIMKDWNCFNDAQWNKTNNKYTFHNDGFIEFLGLDKEDVGKGLRRDVVYINEANKVNYESFNQLSSRAKMTIIDYNPDTHFWAEDLKTDDNFIVLTYEDNEFLNQNEVSAILDYKKRGFKNPNLENYDTEDNILNPYFANKWRVYGIGMTGKLDGVIFTNWAIVDEIPSEARLEKIGIDFGYTNDPTAIVGIYKYNEYVILNEICYKTGLLNNDIGEILQDLNVSVPAYADSAEPKSIEEIKKYYKNIFPAIKGVGSINYGIDTLQGLNILVTKKSYNLIFELEHYTWRVDKTGKMLNIPIDENNHAIDATRYAMSIRTRKSIFA